MVFSASYPLVPLVDATGFLDDPDRLRAFADAEGYLYFRGLVPPERVAATRRVVEESPLGRAVLATGGLEPTAVPGAHLQGHGWDDPEWIQLQQHVARNPDFQSLGGDARVLSALAAAYGEPACRLRGDICRVGLPQALDHTTPPHQDAFYVNEGARDLWTAWMPLVDCPLDLGALAVVPATHLDGLWEHADTEADAPGVQVSTDSVWASSPLAPGDVLMFHGLAVHGPWHNITDDRVRLSVDFRYIPASTPLAEQLQGLVGLPW